MADPVIVNNDDFAGDALRQTVVSYKEAMRAPTEDLNLEYLLKTLSLVNDRSPVKVARNPLTSDRKWNTDAVLYNVRSIGVDDEGHLSVTIRKDNTEFSVEHFIDEYLKLEKRIADKKGPVMYAISEEKNVQLTDVYSHGLTKDHLAGLPFDLVLGYYEED